MKTMTIAAHLADIGAWRTRTVVLAAPSTMMMIGMSRIVVTKGVVGKTSMTVTAMTGDVATEIGTGVEDATQTTTTTMTTTTAIDAETSETRGTSLPRRFE